MALNNLKLKKIPGYDNICNEIYVNFGNGLKESLLQIINIAFGRGTTPKAWKKLMVKTLYKRKGNRRELKNWRGIFLSVGISKILKK